MPAPKWRMKGQWVKNCGCAYGCPCDFNARPTNGNCQGLVAMKIEEGHFDKTALNGLAWAVIVDFPGPLHEGNGTAQPVIDARASAAQRDALLTILSGKEQEEGTLFHIFSLICPTVLEPISAPVEFTFDLAGRRCRVNIPGVLLTESEPIKNPVTGAPHRIQVVMPEGFEHHQAEIASAAVIRASKGITYEYHNTHSSLALVEHLPTGVAHPTA
jgi:hypothetical protein